MPMTGAAWTAEAATTSVAAQSAERRIDLEIDDMGNSRNSLLV
jgi:hypothetical protein